MKPVPRSKADQFAPTHVGDYFVAAAPVLTCPWLVFTSVRPKGMFSGGSATSGILWHTVILNMGIGQPKTLCTIFLTLALYGGVGAFAAPLSGEETDGLFGILRTSELMKAPVIIVGQIDSLKHTKDDVLIRAGRPLAVGASAASANVVQVLKGEQVVKVRIENILNSKDSENVGLQGLVLGKTYVLFLRKSSELEFDPLSPYQFALELEMSPRSMDVNHSVRESLRNIAKDNVSATNSLVATKWAQFFQNLFEQNDFGFWTNRISDGRSEIRAIALETLADNAPQTPGLYPEIMKLIDSKTTLRNPFIRRHLLQLLPRVDATGGPSLADLRNWIDRSDEFQELALARIRETKDMRLADAVVHLMATSKDRDIQYDCIKTLTVLSGDPHLISKPAFLKQPDGYVKDWQKIGEALAKRLEKN